MGVQALQPARVAGTTDAEVERRAVVCSGLARSEPAAHLLLRERCGIEVRLKLRARRDARAPALDPTGRLEARDRGDEVRAGEVVGRRERLSVVVVRLLLGHRRKAIRAAGSDPAKRAGAPADLARDGVSILHGKSLESQREPYGAGAGWLRCQAVMPLTMKSRSPGLT